jgi:putative ABC transport system permease protein
VTKALEARKIDVTTVHRVSAARRLLDDSAAAWSMQLGVLVGMACLLVAGLGLAIAGAASWRTRAGDLAILRLNGVAGRDVRRIAVGEQVPTVAVSVLTGAGIGVLAAHYALPTLPMLPADPVVDLIDLSAAWVTVLVVVVGAALALCAAGAVIAALVARRAGLEHVVGPT